MHNIIRCQTLLVIALLAGSIFGSSITVAQESTEQFIPIGMSPGISDKYSFIGSILEVNNAAATFIVDSNRGSKTIRVSPRTRIWLDRSKSKQTNIKASFNDIQVGRKIEVMHERNDDGLANWIKIESN